MFGLFEGNKNVLEQPFDINNLEHVQVVTQGLKEFRAAKDKVDAIDRPTAMVVGCDIALYMCNILGAVGAALTLAAMGYMSLKYWDRPTHAAELNKAQQQMKKIYDWVEKSSMSAQFKLLRDVADVSPLMQVEQNKLNKLFDYLKTWLPASGAENANAPEALPASALEQAKAIANMVLLAAQKAAYGLSQPQEAPAPQTMRR